MKNQGEFRPAALDVVPSDQGQRLDALLAYLATISRRRAEGWRRHDLHQLIAWLLTIAEQRQADVIPGQLAVLMLVVSRSRFSQAARLQSGKAASRE